MLDAPLTLAGGLTLRRWRAADAPALSRAVEESLDHLRPWMPWAADEPLSPSARRALILQWRIDWRRGLNRSVALWCGDALVGACGRRRVAASAAARALTTLAFELPEIERVEIHNDRANAISARVPRRLGFELVGEIPHPPIAPAETGVRQLWRMRSDDWVARRVAAAERQ